MKLFDTRGTEITVGASIMYAVRHGSHMQMHEAEVTGFGTQDNLHIIHATRAHDRTPVRLYQTNTIVVVPPRGPGPLYDALVVRISINDGAKQVVAEKLVTAVREHVIDIKDRLLDGVFPWLSEKAVEDYLHGK